jgi:hypothetical protein
MSTSWKLLLLCAAALSSGSVAFADVVPITNPDFSAVTVVCGGHYAYQIFGGNCASADPQQDFNSTSGFGWTFLSSGGNGLTGPNTNFNPPSFTGLPFTQAVFLQANNSAVSQTIDFSVGGTYSLSFYLGSRYANCTVPPCLTPYDGNQTVEALIGGDVIGTWALSSFTPFTLENAEFIVPTGGPQVLRFEGVAPGDHTAFLSDVKISGGNASTVPEPNYIAILGMGVILIGILQRHRWHATVP